MLLFLTGNFLSSQGVATQVLSASECLTTVFGMGTGGTIQASSPDILSFHIAMFTQNFTEDRNDFEHFSSSRFVTQSAAPLGQIG